MAKVTNKLQVTLPKRIAEAHGIAPGDDIEFVSSGPVIQIHTSANRAAQIQLSKEERLRLIDQASQRQRAREADSDWPLKQTGERDWQREDLYGKRGFEYVIPSSRPPR
jgi:AbrB family looped-hinge helix DNA binding protein